MVRDISAFEETNFDVLIIGGGIYGATAAWEAASRGLKTALIERSDFGAKTSANSLKTIHGGLRYLQTLDIPRFYESVRERKVMLRIAPHLVHPLPVVMPTYGHLGKGPEILWAGLLVNDILSMHRNRGMESSKLLPNGRILKKSTCLHLIPGIDEREITGAAFWTDAQMHNSERVTLAFIQSAVQAGTVAANYVNCTGFLASNGRVYGVQARDELLGREFEIEVATVVNTTGAWVDEVNKRGGVKSGRKHFKPSTALNLVVKRELLPETAAGVTGRFKYTRPDGSEYKGKRVLFMAPWRKYTIAGTIHRPFEEGPDQLEVTEHDVQTALEEINGAYPGSGILRDEVSFAHKGILPMDGVNPNTGEVKLTKHYSIIDHGIEDNAAGLISVVGVKYTTARDVAQRTINLVCRQSAHCDSNSKTRNTQLFGGDIQCFNRYIKRVIESDPYGLQDRVMRHLVTHHGSHYVSVLRKIEDNPHLATLIPDSNEVTEAEIVYAIEHEMAQKLSDVIQRRTDLGSGEYPGVAAVERCATIMAEQLGWDDHRKQDEISKFHNPYKLFLGI